MTLITTICTVSFLLDPQKSTGSYKPEGTRKTAQWNVTEEYFSPEKRDHALYR